MVAVVHGDVSARQPDRGVDGYDTGGGHHAGGVGDALDVDGEAGNAAAGRRAARFGKAGVRDLERGAHPGDQLYRAVSGSWATFLFCCRAPPRGTLKC